MKKDPPPAMMPSSTAALVAFNASSHDVQQLLVDKHFEDVRVVKDLAENDRVVIGRKA